MNGVINSTVKASRYVAITDAGALDNFTKMADVDTAATPINNAK
jgi:hypothetical protein